MSYSLTTISGRARNAARFVEDSTTVPYGYWFVLAKTTPWPSDDFPPFANPIYDKLPATLGFVYIHTCKVVFPYESGTFQTPMGLFEPVELIPNDPVMTVRMLAMSKAIHVYLEGQLEPENIPLEGSYRMLGIASHLVFYKSPEALAEGTFVPECDVEDYILEWVSNFQPITREQVTRYKLQVLRTF